MAVTRKADVTSQIATTWSTDLFSQAEDLTFWQGLEGPPGSSMPIIRMDDLGKGAGDTIKVDMVLALTGAGQTGDTTTVEGNEEDLKFRQSSITATQLSHGVRWTELAELFINHDMRSSALNQLKKWLAGKIDTRIFTELTGGAGATTVPTLNKWAAGTATTRDTVADTDAGGRLTLNTLTELKAFAQVDRKIEPIRIDEDGNEYFVLVAHPYAIMSLKRDDTKWAQAQREAQVRGADNPLFTGAVGMWDGVIIKSSNRVPRSNNDDPIMVADNIFMGAQAISRSYGMYPDWREELFDYGRQAGIATVCVLGEKLNVFDLTSAGGAAAADLTGIGSMVLYSAALAPSA